MTDKPLVQGTTRRATVGAASGFFEWKKIAELVEKKGTEKTSGKDRAFAARGRRALSSQRQALR